MNGIVMPNAYLDGKDRDAAGSAILKTMQDAHKLRKREVVALRMFAELAGKRAEQWREAETPNRTQRRNVVPRSGPISGKDARDWKLLPHEQEAMKHRYYRACEGRLSQLRTILADLRIHEWIHPRRVFHLYPDAQKTLDLLAKHWARVTPDATFANAWRTRRFKSQADWVTIQDVKQEAEAEEFEAWKASRAVTH